MASAPCYPGPRCFKSVASASLGAQPSSSPFLPSPSFVADSSAPVFPLNVEDFPEQGLGFGQLDHCCAALGERHVYLCYKEPESWPPLVEAADSDRLPRFLAAAIKARKHEMSKKTRLTICEGRDGTDSSNGDILIFPDLIRYRGLTHFDVDAFVDEVLVHNQEWLSGRPERLTGTHIFVCAHGSHDVRCGDAGPKIIGRLKKEISLRGFGGYVFVRPCSHIGGHNKYAGNFIIYCSIAAGESLGPCYGYVGPNDVPRFLDECIGKGYIVDSPFRIIEAESEEAVQSTPQFCNSALPPSEKQVQEQINRNTNGSTYSRMDGFHEGGDSSGCYRRFQSNPRRWQSSSWFEWWEREDTLAALAVLGAAASVAVAYHLYRSHSRC